jgi:hypothetical protein
VWGRLRKTRPARIAKDHSSGAALFPPPALRYVRNIEYGRGCAFYDPATGAEGETLIGELNVKTNRFSKVSFNFITVEDVTAGEAVTATATAFSTKETSEFSAPRTVSSS